LHPSSMRPKQNVRKSRQTLEAEECRKSKTTK
jgi:hypothetical protein